MAGAGHPPTLYAAAADQPPSFPSLTESTRADILVIGGGFTGLSAALHLAEAGHDVTLVEAERIGWGASGRNGGQLHTGQRRDQDWLERRLGRDQAVALWRLAEEAKALVHELRTRHAIDCGWRPGLIEAVHKRRLVASERAYGDRLRDVYGYRDAEWLEADAFAAATGAAGYHGGRYDRGAGHLDPLRFARGLARAAAAAGARLHEGTPATAISGSATGGFAVACSGPVVRCSFIVLAGNAYLRSLDGDVEARVMPIANYIIATEPVGAGAPGGAMPGGEAASDTRFVVRYWRPSPDGRLIFGGGETYRRRAEPADIAALVRGPLLETFPQLVRARIDHAWGGLVAITRPRLPFIRRVRPGVYAAAGYSGQGVALAPFAGKVIAAAIGGDPARLDRFAALPVPRFPGGPHLRGPALVAGMTWYALRDRL